MQPLGKKESIETSSQFLPLNAYENTVSAEDVLAWSKDNESAENRFRPILNRKEKLVLEGYDVVDSFSPFGKSLLPFESDGVPLRFKIALESLRAGGLPIRQNASIYLKGQNDAPKRYQAMLTIDTPKEFSDGKVIPRGINTHGLSDNHDIAIAKTMGEALERYFLTVYKRKNLRYACISEMIQKQEAFLNPLEYPQWNDEQLQHFPERVITVDSTLGWVKGKSLLDNKPAWLPAQMVYWNYELQHNDYIEPMIMEANTNGAGGHFTETKAILSGLRELIQRDAFLLFWLRKVAPPRIDPITVKNPESVKLLNEFRRCALRVEICNLTIDTGEMVVMVGIFDETGKGPSLTIGAGCGNDPEDVIKNALHETLACYQGMHSYSLNTKLSEKYVPFFGENIHQRKRMSLAANPERIKEYSWFFEGAIHPLSSPSKQSTEYVSSEKALDTILEFFREKKWPVYCYTVEHPLLEKIGYKVTHIMAPRLISLFLNENNAPLQHRRLMEDFPKDAISGVTLEAINTTPHPFP